MKEIIIIRDLFHAYGGKKTLVEALRGVNLSVQQGEIFGFLGPNGAGKTTTIKLLLGILIPQKGRLSVFGQDPAYPKTRKKIGYMPEIAEYYQYLTPKELLTMYGDICGVEKNTLKHRVDALLEKADLSKEAGRLMGTFSKGMKQKVSFAQALINDPDLLILDEPTSGLDPLARKHMRQTILDLHDKGKTIFFSSHELSEAELMCTSIAILDKGRILSSGPLEGFLSKKGEKQSLENYFLQVIEEK